MSWCFASRKRAMYVAAASPYCHGTLYDIDPCRRECDEKRPYATQRW